MKVIFDKNGNAYKIEQDDDRSVGPSFRLRIHTSHTQSSFIGYAHFLWEDQNKGILKLADIRVNDQVVIHFRKFRLLWIFSPIERADRNCQRLGLGSQLLKHSLECVKALGGRRVWGEITRDDFGKNPNLPKWYADMGFAVTMETEDSGVAARISMGLKT